MQWKPHTAYSMLSDCGRYKVSKSVGWDGARYMCWEKSGKRWELMDTEAQATFDEAVQMIRKLKAGEAA